jgi:DNA primase
LASDHQIREEVRSRVDIVAVIGEVVPLKRSGASYKGRCPFHEEKTPSFTVSGTKQVFHCFGCKAGGDLFDFVMRIDGLSFPEALRKLAERAGVQLPERTESVRARTEEERARARKDRLFEVNGMAADFFRRMLDTERAAAARAAIDERAIGRRVADAFRLGWAPDSCDELGSHLSGRGVSPAEAEELGLVIPRKDGRGHYDRFRNRLVFPISDVSGNVLAFSGRRLDADPESPKYVNSPESVVYRKGRTLYGLGAARVAIRQSGQAIVVEGNFDLLQLHEKGFENVVAPMGTALTVEHVDVLRRYAREIVVLFDGDAAGRKAARATWDLIAPAGLAGRLVVLPPGEDPDSFLRKRGADALQSLLAAAPGMLEHLIEKAAAEAGGRVHERAAAIGDMSLAVARVKDPIERDLYGKVLGRAFGLDERQVRSFVRENRDVAPRPAAPAPLDPTEAELVGAILDSPELASEASAAGVGDLLEDASLRLVYGWILDEGVGPDLAFLSRDGAEDLPEATRSWLSGRLVEARYDADRAARAFRDTVHKLEFRKATRRRKELDEGIRDAERTGDLSGAARLAAEKAELLRRFKR